MKNIIGAVLIIIGIALVLMQGDRSQVNDPLLNEQGEEISPPPDIDPEGETQIRLQPILGIMAILGGAAVLIYAYNENRSRDRGID